MRKDSSYYMYNKANFEVMCTCRLQCFLVYIFSLSFVCCIRWSDIYGELKYPIVDSTTGNVGLSLRPINHFLFSCHMYYSFIGLV